MFLYIDDGSVFMIFIIVFMTMTLFSSDRTNILNKFLSFETIQSWLPNKNNNFQTLDAINKALFNQIKNTELMTSNSHFWQNQRNRNTLFPDLILPFLKAVKNENRSIGVVEIEGGYGIRAWPVFYAVNSTVWFCVQDHKVEQNNIVDHDIFNLIVNEHIERLNDANTTIILNKQFSQNCFQLFQKPSMENTFDFLNAYYLIHSFNPIEQNRFLQLINYLLKENGKAFISGRTINYSDKDHPIVSFVTKREKCIRPYHGFVAITACETYKKCGDRLIPLGIDLLDVKEQENSEAPCKVQSLSEWSDFVTRNDGSYLEVYQNTLETINFVTKTSLKYAVKKANLEPETRLKILETYFVSSDGERVEKNNSIKEIAFIAAIISKKVGR
jgi:hypothetical protein